MASSNAYALTAIFTALLVTGSAAHAQGKAPDLGASALHLGKERGPVRKIDLSPFKGEVSSEIVAAPTSSLDSSFVVYTRLAPGAKQKGLYTLPVDHTYLVLSGRMDVQLGTDTFTVGPETLVLVPANTPHRIWNSSSKQVDELEVVTPAPLTSLVAMMKPAQPRKIDNAAQYIRQAPPLGKLAGGQGHESLNERLLTDRDTGSPSIQERLNEVLPGGGRTELHVHPFDQVYFIRSGSMTVTYGLSTYEAPANSLVVIPKGTLHNNTNTGTDPQSSVTLLLPQTPKGVPAGRDVAFK